MENKSEQERLREQYLAELAGEDPGEKTVAAWGAEKKSVSGGQQEAGEKARRLRDQYLAELAGEDPGEKTVAAWERKESANERGEREAREKAEREAKEKAEREAREKAQREAKEKAQREAREKAQREAREKAEREAREKAEREAKKPAARPAPRSKKPLILGLCALALLAVALCVILIPKGGETPSAETPVDPSVFDSDWVSADKYLTEGDLELAIFFDGSGRTEKLLIRVKGVITAEYEFIWSGDRIDQLFLTNPKGQVVVQHQYMYNDSGALYCDGIVTEYEVLYSDYDENADYPWSDPISPEAEVMPNATVGYPIFVSEDTYRVLQIGDPEDYGRAVEGCSYGQEWHESKTFCAAYSPLEKYQISFSFYLGTNGGPGGSFINIPFSISVVEDPDDPSQYYYYYYDASWNAVDPW